MRQRRLRWRRIRQLTFNYGGYVRGVVAVMDGESPTDVNNQPE
jgi:hypothetical protein